MNARVLKFYEFDIFQQLRGLPEKIVEFEAKTGESLPDIYDYTFLEAMQTEEMTLVLGRIGFIYVVMMEKNEEIAYELFENRRNLVLWSENFIEQIIKSHETIPMTSIEEHNLKTNIQGFRKKVQQIPVEE